VIDLLARQPSSEAGLLVLAALRRSVSKMQARWVTGSYVAQSSARILVVINPTDEDVACIAEWKQRGPGKLILLGSLPESLMRLLGLQTVEWPQTTHDWSRSAPAPAYGFAESAGKVVYTEHAADLKAAHWQRPLERFDFTDEWNNLGYGAIRRDSSPWALAMPLSGVKQNVLANIAIDGQFASAYAVLHDELTCSTLWFNRAVGPIDSFEWRLVENFLSFWRHSELPCQPVLADIPFGCDAGVTMRLDCDEDIESSRALRNLYHELSVPFSLAVHTSNLRDPSQHALLQEMAAAGESILSHTATHAPNWGGSYEAALKEGQESMVLLEEVTGRKIRYAVSPFHQSPHYALAGLADAGLVGCIGGIIRNDPEFLLARGGTLAGLPEGFIGHSQQHMLHGDCLLAGDDPLAISRQAFDRAFETGTLFGFLDHPFSPRYQYGWLDESTRISMHRELIAHIRAQAPGVRFLSEDQAMDFLLMKSQWQVESDVDGYSLKAPEGIMQTELLPAVEYAGHRFIANTGRFPQ
jgi:hypothetical protein